MAGILVLLLNSVFLLIMAILIARAGSASARAFVEETWDKTKSLFGRLRGCVQRRSTVYETSDVRVRVSHRPSTERLVGGVQLSHRGSSMELLRNTIFSRSGTIMETGDSLNVPR